ncbi:mechanosensitive ion channel family protein [Novosphingobium sp. G106]|uniref:mechanosensitive ion channel family protein n=1 Tax=Novosphingobium sp. G106 TaxID=2849500 RepID=UPI001C2D78B9|nr:mechanosensitive ion channel family protein [Novosphingobium sp. G106]MBV1691348.1 mechanosensitive ion channel family protein [Novosphingobium sp. G106]
MDRFAAALPPWLWSLSTLTAVALASIAAHYILYRLLDRAAERTKTPTDNFFVRRLRAPSRWLFLAFAVTATQPALSLSRQGTEAWNRGAGLVMPGLFGWTGIALLGVVLDFVQAKADTTVADNLRARRRQTRAGILYRIAVFIVLLITFCMMLMSIPSVRSIGVTLIASAGLAALAVGAAAQPALKNLIAGVQMAVTEPISIDDVVIMDGEWGRIEEIRLTYAVVKIWDERRLIVPISKFLENSFQNWTRHTSQILGNVIWYFDATVDVPRLRTKLEELVTVNERWDGRFFNLQVTDARPESIEIRALMTAKDASTAFDLRCDIRESMLDFVRREMPEALVRYRADLNEGAAIGMAA